MDDAALVGARHRADWCRALQADHHRERHRQLHQQLRAAGGEPWNGGGLPRNSARRGTVCSDALAGLCVQRLQYMDSAEYRAVHYLQDARGSFYAHS